MIVSILLSRKRNPYKVLASLLACMTLVLSGCKDDKISQDAYIKGKIVNPRSKIAVITNYEQINDTLLLNEKNEFEVKLKNISAGLYTFWHGSEYQSIYLEPGDSTLVFVDTKSFDESMAFSNGHDAENNYLIALFTDLETSNKKLLALYKNEPKAFLKSIEKNARNRLKKLELAAVNQKFAASFVEIATNIIWFNTYSKKERYVGAHYSKRDMHKKCELPVSFYDHRDKVKLDNPKLLNNYAFKAYLNSLIANMTLEKLSEEKVPASDATRHITRLQVTASLIKNATIRESYLLNYTRNVLRNADSHELPKKVLDEYLKLSKNPANESTMKLLAAGFDHLRTGSDIADLKLQNAYNLEVTLGDIVKNMTIIYFWNSKEENYNMQVHHVVADLRKKYPSMTFIGINTDDTQDNNWQKALNTFNSGKTDEYKVAANNGYNLQNTSISNKRAMLVDKDLTIIDGSINLLHYKIETTLLGYVSK